ncbi:MAG: hypothetical protein FJW31_30015 [Acidobacteria bacterium]|nr:hypothetical protein [Acidobacteriota bacterium]
MDIDADENPRDSHARLKTEMWDKRDYGNCVLLTPDTPPLLVNQRILALYLSPTDLMLLEFLSYYGNTPDFRNFFFGQETGGVNQWNVGVGGVMDAPCPLPSISEQREIMQRIYKAITAVDQIQIEANRALALLARLDQVTLSKAFSGELL